VELDENTDPRFVSRSRERIIGILKTDGPNVFVNDRRVSSGTRIANGDHIRTGPRSGARLELETHQACRLSIEDFHRGKIYGNTDRCSHDIVLEHAHGQSNQPQTEYIMSVEGGNPVITLIAGEMDLRFSRNPRERVTLYAYQDARITPAGILGPRDVSGATIRQRTRWRHEFNYDKPGYTPSPEVIEAVGATIWEFLRNRDNQHDSTPPRTRTPPYQPPDDSRPPRYQPPYDNRPSTPSGFSTPGSPDFQRPVASYVSVPDLNQKSLKDARNILSRRGLNVQVDPANAKSDYWVLRQTPSAGKSVKKGSTVKIRVTAPIR